MAGSCRRARGSGVTPAVSGTARLWPPVLITRLVGLLPGAGASNLIFSFTSTRNRFWGILQLLAPSGLGVHFVEGAWGLFLFLVFVGLLLVRGGVHPGWHSPWGRLEMSFLALCCSGRHMDYECIDYECMACHI